MADEVAGSQLVVVGSWTDRQGRQRIDHGFLVAQAMADVDSPVALIAHEPATGDRCRRREPPSILRLMQVDSSVRRKDIHFHQALLTLGNGPAVAFPTVARALDAVRSGDVSASLVPIENSVEGGVTATLDYLALLDSPLQIAKEVVIPVSFDLCVRPGTTFNDIKRIISHPHAVAQVRGWLDAQLPDAVVIERGSTAGAAQAGCATDIGFQRYHVREGRCRPVRPATLASDISDNEQAATRFVLVTKPGPSPKRTGYDKTTLVAYMRQDQPGALLEILQQLASRGVNLCRVESRPTKKILGDYCFSIDAEGHVSDARVAESLMGLHRVCKRVVFLGSYPRADGKEPKVPYGGRDSDYQAALDWLRQVSPEIPRLPYDRT